jgi:hypothetical protein
MYFRRYNFTELINEQFFRNPVKAGTVYKKILY